MNRCSSPLRRAGTALALVVAISPEIARAQDTASKASAVELFDHATQLIEQGKVGEACPKFSASYRLDPQLGSLLHLADCYERNNQLASAWGSFREAEELARKRNDERADMAQQRAASLTPRLSRLSIVVPPDSKVSALELRLNGTSVPEVQWGAAAPIDAGAHTIEARAPGYETWSASVDVTGETQAVRVQIPLLTPKPVAERPPGAAPPLPVSIRIEDRGASIRTLGWVGMGAGVVGLGLGIVFEVQKGSKLDQRDRVCPGFMNCTVPQSKEIQSLSDDASTSHSIATGAFIVGGVLAAGGLAAVIFAPQPELRTEAAWVYPIIAPDVLGVSGGTTW